MNETISDIPRIFTAIAEWSACIPFVLLLKKRFKFKDARFWLFTVLTLGFFVGIHTGLSFLPDYFIVPGIILAMAGIMLSIWLLSDIKITEAIFWTARAFILAEFMASLEWQLYFYLSQTFPFLEQIAFNYGFFVLVYAAILTGIFFLEKRHLTGNQRLGFQVREIVLSVVIAVVMFLLSNISFIFPGSPLSGHFPSEIFYIRTLVGLCTLILLYAQQEQRRWHYNKLELDSVRKVLSWQYEQYCLSRDNNEYLNRKYHDFKHQIETIQMEDNPEKRAEYLSDLKKAIKIYEAQSDSGNVVLDTILTVKSRRCVEQGVNFTCVADGILLDFMDAMDICSIVGNALDNAIESVSQLGAPEKRVIKMAVYSQNGSVILRFENYIEKDIQFDKGLPKTTKKNNAEHGYGIKSIQYSVEKYDGNVDISVKNNWFVLNVLIPISPPEAVSTNAVG